MTALSTEIFIDRSIRKHGDKYDYKKSIYVSYESKLIITCDTHGDFLISPDKHLSGGGCQKCSLEGRGKKIRLSTDEFIVKAKLVHGNTYDYSKVCYIKSNINVDIICKTHRLFKQTPNTHLSGAGCLQCAIEKNSYKQRKTLDDFKEKAKIKHGDKYCYSTVEYVNTETKVNILCSKHGLFSQKAGNHLNGQGCPKCANEIRGDSRKFDVLQFIKNARAIHGDKYDYSCSEYLNSQKPISILCPEHGAFNQIANDHIQGRGCSVCGDITKANKTRVPISEFIDRANKKHGYLYDYSNVFYVNGKSKISIVCKKHGSFEQRPINHLRGQGCPKCTFNISKPETELVNLLKSHGLDVYINKSLGDETYRTYRYDCLIPEKKVVIEFNGVYWHSSANKHEAYHQEKREHAERNGYRLITIWEDEWRRNKKNINTRLIKILAGKEDVARGNEIVLDLDYQCYKKYLRQGYKITSLAPVARRRIYGWSKKGHICFNSGVAVLRKA